MALTQKYGIKYPFSSSNDDGTFMDVNETLTDGVKSQVLHVIFTPKGQKLRDPEFGTNLIRFVFDPSDSLTIGDVKSEITTQVAKYVPSVDFRDITIYKNEDEEGEVVVVIEYGVKKGNKTEVTKVAVKL